MQETMRCLQQLLSRFINFSDLNLYWFYQSASGTFDYSGRNRSQVNLREIDNEGAIRTDVYALPMYTFARP